MEEAWQPGSGFPEPRSPLPAAGLYRVVSVLSLDWQPMGLIPMYCFGVSRQHGSDGTMSVSIEGVKVGTIAADGGHAVSTLVCAGVCLMDISVCVLVSCACGFE